MITHDLLEQLAAAAPEAPALPASGHRGTSRDLDGWLLAHQDLIHVTSTAPWRGGRKWILNPCPWIASHDNGSAFIVQFPNGAIAAGCHHHSCAGKDWRQLRALVEPDPLVDAPNLLEPDAEDEPLPEIVVSNRRLSRITADGLAAISQANPLSPRLFQQSGTLVRLRHEEGAPRVEALTVPSLRGELDRVAYWRRVTVTHGVQPTWPPMGVVQDILSLPTYNLPRLTAVVETPCFTADGELISAAGFHLLPASTCTSAPLGSQTSRALRQPPISNGPRSC
jgi:hypothetical protein